MFTCEAAIPLISGARFISQSKHDFQCSFSGLQHSTCCRQGRTWHVSYCCIFASQPNHRCSIMHSFHCSSLVPVNHSWHPSMNAIENPLNFNRGFCSGLLRYTNCSHLSATPGAALLPYLLFSALRLLLSGIPTRLLASCLCLTSSAIELLTSLHLIGTIASPSYCGRGSLQTASRGVAPLSRTLTSIRIVDVL